MIAVAEAGPGFADWAAVRALVADAFATMEGRIDPPSSLHRMTTEDFAALARAGVCLLARDGGRLVGCAFLTPRDDALHLGKLAVAPDRQREGIGRRLVAAAEGVALRRGLNALTLSTRIELVENHAAFARLGFVRMAETAHPGYDRPTSVTFARPLTGDRAA